MSRHKDTRFVPEVWPPTKDAYVSIEELTKSRVSFNHNLHYKIPTKESAIQTF
jgi:hypothetical protein